MKSKTEKVLIGFLLLLLAFIVTSCKTTVNATVKCDNLGRIRSDFGVLNVQNVGLGTVLVLEPETKLAYKLMVIPPPEGSTAETEAARDKLELILESKFSLSFDISPPADIQAQIKNYIDANTQFVLYDGKRREVLDPLKELNNNEAVIERVKDIDPSLFIVYIQAVQLADQLDILLKRGVSAGAGVNTLKYGKYNVNVSYAFKQQISGIATEGGAWFWSSTPVKYNTELGKFVLDTRPLDIYEYEFAQHLF